MPRAADRKNDACDRNPFQFGKTFSPQRRRATEEARPFFLFLVSLWLCVSVVNGFLNREGKRGGGSFGMSECRFLRGLCRGGRRSGGLPRLHKLVRCVCRDMGLALGRGNRFRSGCDLTGLLLRSRGFAGLW